MAREPYSVNGHISNRSILTWENFCWFFAIFSGKETNENMMIYAISEFFPQCFTFSTRIEKKYATLYCGKKNMWKCSTIFDHWQRTVTCLFHREKKSKQCFTKKLPNAVKLFTHNFSASPSQLHIKTKIQITGTHLTVTLSPSLNQMQ